MKPFPDIVGWWSALDRPLRRLPRWAAALLLGLSVALCLWSGPAEYHYGHHAAAVNRARLKRGDRRDMDLYQTIDELMAKAGGATVSKATTPKAPAAKASSVKKTAH